MVDRFKINGVAGATSITDVRLKNCTAITVSLEGVFYFIVYSTPGDLEVWHKSTEGQLIFKEVFVLNQDRKQPVINIMVNR